MSLQNLASDAKEQRDLVSNFSLVCNIHGLYSAWKSYSELDSDSKLSLRKYRSDDDLIDFPSFISRVQESRPCGMASKMEKMSLIEEVNCELKNLSKKERKSYLNGNLLTLEI